MLSSLTLQTLWVSKGWALGPLAASGQKPAFPPCPQLICRVEGRGGPELELPLSLLVVPSLTLDLAQQRKESGALALAPRGLSFLLSLLSALKRPASGRVVGPSLNPRPGVESPLRERQ